MKVFEIFQSVSGEVCNFHQGRICTLVRFSGCCCNCDWCDAPEARSPSSGKELSPREVLKKVKQFGHKYIVLTGGEPLIQSELAELINLLLANNFIISIETSGAVVPGLEIPEHLCSWVVDFKPLSSGESKNMVFPYNFLSETDFIKFTILSKGDFNFALARIPALKTKAQIAFSPIHGKLSAHVLMEWILKEGISPILNLQIHKFIGAK